MKLPIGRRIKKVELEEIVLKIDVENHDNNSMTFHSVTTVDSKINILPLLDDDQWEIIMWQLEKNINEEVSYDVNYEGRDLKAYGVWKVNRTFHDNIPDFELTRVTKPNSNRNLLRYMDDLDYMYIDQLVSNLDEN